MIIFYSSSYCKIIRSVFLFSTVTLLGYLLPGCSGKSGDDGQEEETRKKETKALTLIRNDDCLNCHNIEDKSVGPSYMRVAQRYEADFSTVNRLADKIIEGGGGLWGGGQMTEHRFLKKENARKIVRWILSLDDSVANKNPMTTTPGVRLAEAFQAGQPAGKNGLILKAYAMEDLEVSGADALPEIPAHAIPVDSGIIKFIHFTGLEAFEPLQENAMLQATGFITIQKKGKYFVKLVKGGKGRVILNGAIAVNENDWDQENDMDLSPGTYPITIEFLAGPGAKVLSLQWIPPDEEYFRVIPQEVLTISP